ncbi:hypothetical protein IIA29_02280 [candidate division KSB1 bacterium]|nr:hypothetical protein [candidate division KSB1 bacterium]
MSENPLTEVEFQRELINRFFHPSSYFFCCINQELEPLLNEVSKGEEQKYLLLGNLMDKLVAAEDAVEELESLGEIDGFAEFNDKLFQGAQHLYTTHLDGERMKIEIEGLAHSVLNSALLAFEDESAVAELRRLLSVNGVEPDEAESPTTDTQECPELPSERFSSNRAEFDLAGEKSLPDEPDLARQDVQETQADPDVSAVAGDSSISNKRSSRVSDVGVETPKIEMSEEPASVIAAFSEKVRHLMAPMTDLVARLSPSEMCATDLNKFAEVLESVTMTAIIFGFEAFEQITSKARKAVLEVRELEDYAVGHAVAAETGAILAGLLENPENVDTATVKQSTEKILQLLAKPQEEPEIEVDPEEPSDPHDEFALPVEEDGSELAENAFNIPGEEDDEIRTLISEINREQAKQDNGKDAGVGDDADDQKDKPESDSQKPNSSNSDSAQSAPVAAHAIRAVHQGNFSIYRQQSELYFSVIEDALQTLEKQQNNQTALEDLELASNALYGLTLKLDLDPMGALPNVVLNLIKNMLATNYSFSTVEHKLIRNAFRYFESLETPDETSGEEFQAVLASVNDLNMRVQRGASAHHRLRNYSGSAVGLA